MSAIESLRKGVVAFTLKLEQVARDLAGPNPTSAGEDLRAAAVDLRAACDPVSMDVTDAERDLAGRVTEVERNIVLGAEVQSKISGEVTAALTEVSETLRGVIEKMQEFEQKIGTDPTSVDFGSRLAALERQTTTQSEKLRNLEIKLDELETELD